MKDIKYYYRPKTVPEGAILKYVEVFDTYVMFAYTFDTDKESKDATKDVLLLWFRYFDDSQKYIQNITNRHNCNIYNLEEQIKGMTIMSHKNFNEAKAKMRQVTQHGDSSGFRMELASKEAYHGRSRKRI